MWSRWFSFLLKFFVPPSSVFVIMTLRCWFLGSQSRDQVAFGHFNLQAVCEKQKRHSEINFWPEKSRFLIWLMRYVSANRDFVNQVSYDHRREFVTFPKTITFPFRNFPENLATRPSGRGRGQWELTADKSLFHFNCVFVKNHATYYPMTLIFRKSWQRTILKIWTKQTLIVVS